MFDGYYYLHTNGELIYKKFEPESDSPFVKKIWAIDTTDRKNAWDIIVESLSMGANKEQVLGLIKKWGCDLKDLVMYLTCEENPSEIKRKGLKIYFDVIGADYDKWFDWLSKSSSDDSDLDWDSMPKPEG